MARARNIKPSFFHNDTLAEINPLGRLLFVALWTLADRAGRLEDRPKRIKAEALPYDNCNIDKLLDDLQTRGFILRYSVGEARFIQVLAFTKHQNPHLREPASTIPAPCQHGAVTVPSTAQAPDEHGTGPADSPFLIPDSPLPDSGAATGPSRPEGGDNVAEKRGKPTALRNGPMPIGVILAAAKAVGIEGRPGETKEDVKRRYFAKLESRQANTA